MYERVCLSVCQSVCLSPRISLRNFLRVLPWLGLDVRFVNSGKK